MGESVSDQKIVAVFGGGAPQEGTPAYAEAEQLGRLLAEAGYTVLNGGYGGTMEAVSRGASQTGGHVVAVTCDIFDVPINDWSHEERHTKDLYERLERIIEPADAYVVLRGGMGTLAELAVVWNLAKIGVAIKPIIVVGGAWQSLFEAIRTELYVDDHHFHHLRFVDSSDEVLAGLQGAFTETR